MPRFYFHLSTPKGRERDDIGSDCLSAEAAYLEARRAAMEISADLLRRAETPDPYRFEVCDPQGQAVFDLPFREVLLAPPQGRPTAQDALISRTRERLQRARELRADVNAGLAEARTLLATTVDVLRRSQRVGPPQAAPADDA
jgi:hypothetical protein